MNTDVNGDTPSGGGDKTIKGMEIPDDSPLKSKNSTPKVQISFGNTFSLPSQNNGHSDHHPAMIYSNDQTFYQTDIHNPLSLTDKGANKNDLTEGNHLFEAKFRIGNTHFQAGIIGYKEKTESDANGFGYEAPGPLLATGSYDMKLFGNNKTNLASFGVNLNAGIGVGAAIGGARLNGVMYGGGLAGYKAIGVASAAIVKVDVNFLSRMVFSVMATATNMRIQGYSGAPQGSQGGQNYTSFSVKGAIGVNIGRK